MSDSRVLDLLSKQSQLENDRAQWDQHWREVAERVLPRQDDFQNTRSAGGGEKRSEKIFDATAVLALDRAASAIDSLISPSAQMYQAWEPEDERLMEDRKVRLFLDELRNRQFKMRYRPKANFASQAHECYVSLMAFGTLGMFVDDYLGIGTRYKSIALSELYIAENYAGMIDYVHRKFQLSARAAVQMFPKGLPETITKMAEKEPFRKFDFIHCVRPNDSMNPRRKDFGGMAWSSYYVSCEGKVLLGAGGYRTMPYAVSRHVTAPKEVYGRSPAMQVLPDIKMVNEMEKTMIRAAHKIVDPPLLIYGDGVLSAFNTRPNALNYGGVDANGNQLVHPLKTGSNLPVGIEMTEQKRKVINDAFYVTLFQILVQNPQMTATEALIRAQEKGQLLAPTVGRQQSEFLGPMSERELDIMQAAGQIPDVPEKLRKSGGGVKAVYTSPLTRLRRAEDGVAIQRTLDMAIKIKTADPDSDVMDIVDDDATFKLLADIYGAPAKMLRDSGVVQQMRDARNQAKQAEAEASQMRDSSGAVKNLAQAAQAAGIVSQSPSQVGV